MAVPTTCLAVSSMPMSPSTSFRSAVLWSVIADVILPEFATTRQTLSRVDGLVTDAACVNCSEFHRSPPQLCLLFLVGEIFFLHGTCSLLLPARSLLAEARTRSKRAPRNFSSSSLERNRSCVQESTSSTQPSN